ncbi:hypothetical protein HDU98_006207, partial [Podochytrium sp. JEL0797]
MLDADKTTQESRWSTGNAPEMEPKKTSKYRLKELILKHNLVTDISPIMMLEPNPPSNRSQMPSVGDADGGDEKKAPIALVEEKQKKLLKMIGVLFMKKGTVRAVKRSSMLSANFGSSFAAAEDGGAEVNVNVLNYQLPANLHLDFKPTLAGSSVLAPDFRNGLNGRKMERFDLQAPRPSFIPRPTSKQQSKRERVEIIPLSLVPQAEEAPTPENPLEVPFPAYQTDTKRESTPKRTQQRPQTVPLAKPNPNAFRNRFSTTKSAKPRFKPANAILETNCKKEGNRVT